MSFSSELREELINLKMWDNSSSLKQEEQIARLCIREAFIKSGFITDPNKEYHLEISFKTKKKAQEMVELLSNYEIAAKVVKKGNGYIAYIKEGEGISSILALMGANNSVLRFEEIRVEKDARNNINRIVNCETANLNKTIEAAKEQIESIKLIKKKHIFNTLPDTLKEVAEMRLKYPEATYEELGEKLAKPIGKSGVSHRLKKIIQLSKEL